ncbi:MAG: electron transport complex subunit RsxG [Gammaproteobacteria bacterium]|nr:MAG: electron transport complex subunit RsxG [Gammaproteobacteria bacterium]
MNNSEKAPIWASGAILAVLAAICTALVAFTHSTTAPRIAANAQAYLEQSLKPVLEGLEYDGKLSESTLIIEPPHELPGDAPVTVYRVYAGGAPVAALFIVTAKDGFTGPIKLLVGIAANGEISGVRVLQHRETPGLGDLIEASKSDWIEQFRKRSLADPDRELWAIKRDGGVYDQLTGASITPRSVIKAIKETLLYFEANHEQVFADVGDQSE